MASFEAGTKMLMENIIAATDGGDTTVIASVVTFLKHTVGPATQAACADPALSSGPPAPLIHAPAHTPPTANAKVRFTYPVSRDAL